MSESPSSSQRMTRLQSRRLFGACKYHEKDLSKGKEKVDECVVVSAKEKKQNQEKNSEDVGVSLKKKHKVSDQLDKPSYSLSEVEVWDFVVRPSDYYMTRVSVHTNYLIVNELKDKLTKVYKRKSMYRCSGFPLAFQYWFYECCPYADNKLAVRVGDSVPRILNWSVTIKPNYKKVKFAFSDINREQLKDEVLSMKQLKTSLFDLIFKALNIKEGSKSATLNEYHSGNNVGLKNDDTHAGNPIGINLSDNAGWQTDGDHIDVVAGDHLIDNVIDDIRKETVGVGDHIDTDAVVKKIDTDLDCTSVTLKATEVLVDVGSIRNNVDDTFVGDKSTIILDDKPVVPHRIRKPTTICESPYVSKFDSHCRNVQESVNNLENAFDFGVITIKTNEWFYTLGYEGVPLTDSDNEIIKYILGYVMMCNVPWDCGVLVAAFAEYMIEGFQIPASLNDIDSIQSRYGVNDDFRFRYLFFTISSMVNEVA
ncbi:hypothetical protein CQW23_10110 [Capsicum baccatum]|uniref:Ubiquitin-like protease family profile domain-containing protein n=1 Tax=Capsicum baccatum TaxID=33114 RepID=A0A2G2WYR3_CAPBA|nr:hypothetical protein CQW23_10110 [Capsicum baccatum]